MVIDNSAQPLIGLRAAIAGTECVPASYVWNGGANFFYGPSINQAARSSASSLLVYDVYQSLRFMTAGYELVDVPTVKSVWRTTAGPGPWKYVHDENVNEDAT